MALQTMTTEAQAALLVALFTAGIGLIAAINKFIEARAKAIVIEVEADKDTTTTQNVAVKLISDRFAKSDDLNMKLQRELRECEVRDATKDGTIRDLQRMNHELGERNATQASMMLQLSQEHEAEKMAHEQTKRELQTVSAQFAAELARNGRVVNGDGGGEPP